jgi:serine/threonine protein kinase
VTPASTNPDESSCLDAVPTVTNIVGKIFAKRYLIQSVLGRGGFGVTFLARNIYLPGQPPCVVKKLAPRFSDSSLMAAARWRFYQEARSLSRLGSHAQIPALLDYFQIGTDLYLVEEYIPGRTLAQLVQEQRRFTETEVASFLVRMLHLLGYIHRHRLIHRDIKPQNIILCQTDLRFVLVDFGAVKDLYPSRETIDRNIVSRAIGTPGFAPPEQLADRTVYASDLYSLGITCLYLLTGKEPAQFPTDPYTCELIWAEGLKIDRDLRDIISKMVTINIADRYKSASQIITALDSRSVRAKLRRYLDRKYAIAKTNPIESPNHYPAAIHWALALNN